MSFRASLLALLSVNRRSPYPIANALAETEFWTATMQALSSRSDPAPSSASPNCESAHAQHAYQQVWDGGFQHLTLLFHLSDGDDESSISAAYANPLVIPLTFSTGTGLGFRNFFAGASDIASASRFYQGKRLDQTLDAPPAAFQAPLATADCPLKS